MTLEIRNTGGRELRVRSIRLNFTRDGKHSLSLPALNYFENPTSSTSILFTPFSLKPGETWAHAVVCLNDFDRQIEKEFRANLSALTADISNKIQSRTSDDKKTVVARPELVQPFELLFDKLFTWLPGEYIVEVQVNADPGSASYCKKYRFTLFESDTTELRNLKNDYKYGGGLSYNLPLHAGIFVPLSEHIDAKRM
jgi:hypothetical protein